MSLDLSIENWWNDLDIDEQNVLIEMAYKMTGEDFSLHGIIINNDGKYVNRGDK